MKSESYRKISKCTCSLTILNYYTFSIGSMPNQTSSGPHHAIGNCNHTDDFRTLLRRQRLRFQHYCENRADWTAPPGGWACNLRSGSASGRRQQTAVSPMSRSAGIRPSSFAARVRWVSSSWSNCRLSTYDKPRMSCSLQKIISALKKNNK